MMVYTLENVSFFAQVSFND